MKKIYVLLMMLILTSCLNPFLEPSKIGDCMGYTNAVGQYVSFSSTPQLNNLTTLTMMTWVYQTAWGSSASPTNGNSVIGAVYDTSDKAIYQRIQTTDNASRKAFLYLNGATGGFGAWGTPVGSISLNTLYFLVATMDTTSVTNDPLLYINGVSQTVTEINTPLTVYKNPITSEVYFANNYLINQPFLGNIYSYAVYNRILSQSEITDAYNSRLAIPTYRGLVFAPQLWGCAGGVAEGGTMAAGNTVADAVSGALGVPSGSPVFKGDTVLTFQS